MNKETALPKYFQIADMPLLGNEYAVIRKIPGPLQMPVIRASYGKSVVVEFPSDARLDTSMEHGVKLVSVIPNTHNILIIERRVCEALASTGAIIESLPFTLYDYKGRIASQDYVIANPLCVLDCLDPSASDIKISHGITTGVRKPVLSRKKLTNAPDVFRIREEPRRILITDRIINVLKALSPETKGIQGTPIEVA